LVNFLFILFPQFRELLISFLLPFHLLLLIFKFYVELSFLPLPLSRLKLLLQIQDFCPSFVIDFPALGHFFIQTLKGYQLLGKVSNLFTAFKDDLLQALALLLLAANQLSHFSHSFFTER
jgi:hypothetical protein